MCIRDRHYVNRLLVVLSGTSYVKLRFLQKTWHEGWWRSASSFRWTHPWTWNQRLIVTLLSKASLLAYGMETCQNSIELLFLILLQMKYPHRLLFAAKWQPKITDTSVYHFGVVSVSKIYFWCHKAPNWLSLRIFVSRLHHSSEP